MEIDVHKADGIHYKTYLPNVCQNIHRDHDKRSILTNILTLLLKHPLSKTRTRLYPKVYRYCYSYKKHGFTFRVRNKLIKNICFIKNFVLINRHCSGDE